MFILSEVSLSLFSCITLLIWLTNVINRTAYDDATAL